VQTSALKHLGATLKESVGILRQQQLPTSELAATLVAAKWSADDAVSGMQDAGFSWADIVAALRGMRLTADAIAKQARAHKVGTGPLTAALLANKLSERDALHAERAAGYDWVTLATGFHETGMAPSELAQAWKREGAKLPDVVASLRKLNTEDAELVSALRGAGYGTPAIAAELIAAGSSAGQAATVLAHAQIGWTEIAKALAASRITGMPLMAALKQAQCPPVDAAVAVSAGGSARADVARFMKDLAYDRVYVARALKQLGSSTADIATTLRQLGFAIGDVALALRLSELPASSVTAALKAAHCPAAEIPAALAYAGFKH
jgi:hypothetical protein